MTKIPEQILIVYPRRDFQLADLAKIKYLDYPLQRHKIWHDSHKKNHPDLGRHFRLIFEGDLTLVEQLSIR